MIKSKEGWCGAKNADLAKSMKISARWVQEVYLKPGTKPKINRIKISSYDMDEKKKKRAVDKINELGLGDKLELVDDWHTKRSIEKSLQTSVNNKNDNKTGMSKDDDDAIARWAKKESKKTGMNFESLDSWARAKMYKKA